jgi:peptidoglycan/xylan/chitin deacetylase (PgdA/CDA1 family)
VALTFDDGPNPAVTPALLTLLKRRQVPATFFVVGQRVAAAPALVRRAARDGHAIGNHTYQHETLTSLSDAGVRSTLGRTQRAVRAAGAPRARLMRPPYGAVNGRVRSVAAEMGLRTVLWDVDTRDWQSGSSAVIAERVLSAIGPHRRNIVLLHDGVARSGLTLGAVPSVITRARARGYCFARLGPDGNPAPPVPRTRIRDAAGREGGSGTSGRLRFTIRMDRPTSRAVSVRVRTADGSATRGLDYRGVDRRVDFPTGTVSRTISVRIRDDRTDEPAERLQVRLDRPRGMTLGRRTATGTIRDDDPTPRLTLEGDTVAEPLDGVVGAQVTLRLDRPRSRGIRVHLVTEPDTADELDYVPLDTSVVIPAGSRSVTLTVDVVADTLDEGLESFQVSAATSGAVVQGPPAAVVITPPTLPARPRSHAPDPG